MATGDLFDEKIGWKAGGVITGGVGERSIAAPESVAGGKIYGEPGYRTIVPQELHGPVIDRSNAVARRISETTARGMITTPALEPWAGQVKNPAVESWSGLRDTAYRSVHGLSPEASTPWPSPQPVIKQRAPIGYEGPSEAERFGGVVPPAGATPVVPAQSPGEGFYQYTKPDGSIGFTDDSRNVPAGITPEYRKWDSAGTRGGSLVEIPGSTAGYRGSSPEQMELDTRARWEQPGYAEKAGAEARAGSPMIQNQYTGQMSGSTGIVTPGYARTAEDVERERYGGILPPREPKTFDYNDYSSTIARMGGEKVPVALRIAVFKHMQEDAANAQKNYSETMQNFSKIRAAQSADLPARIAATSQARAREFEMRVAAAKLPGEINKLAAEATLATANASGAYSKQAHEEAQIRLISSQIESRGDKRASERAKIYTAALSSELRPEERAKLTLQALIELPQILAQSNQYGAYATAIQKSYPNIKIPASPPEAGTPLSDGVNTIIWDGTKYVKPGPITR